MSYTAPFHMSCVGVGWKMCAAYRASFRHILGKKGQFTFHPLFATLLTSAFSKQNSVISLEDWVLVLKLFTTATGKLEESSLRRWRFYKRATDRNWQTKVLDTWKVIQLNFVWKVLIVVFLSCPLVKKHADLLGSFLYPQSTMKDMYSKPTNRTELSIPMETESLA